MTPTEAYVKVYKHQCLRVPIRTIFRIENVNVEN